MMWAAIYILLAVVLLLFLPPVEEAVRRWLGRDPRLIFAVPATLSALFAAVLWRLGAPIAGVAPLITAYTFLPATLVFLNGRGAGRPWLDFVSILLLWLPLELNLGQRLIPRPVQAGAHTLAYGIAVTLALFLFLLFRNLDGMKYRLPRKLSDAWLPLAGLLVVAPLLIMFGLSLGFIAPFHVPPDLSAAWVGKRFVMILLGVALPEEILFRSLIQNWIMHRLGFNHKSLLIAALIFGSAHLNNAPFPFPNWRYMILATVAGLAYGKVFQRSTTVLSSAMLHAMVNTLRHCFF